MIIIGLIIGGILKGKELVINARVANFVAQERALESAIMVYSDSYKAIPGDDPRATQRLGGCGPANFCQNGNGDGWIGDPYSGGVGLGAKFYGQSETVQFWKHLAIADLTDDVLPNADPATPAWNYTHPSTAFDGVLEMYHEVGGLSNGSNMRGQLLRFTRNGLDPTRIDDQGQAAVSPMTAQRIDTKMDDGFPLTGRLVVWDYGNYGCDNRLDGTAGFDNSIAQESCVLFFKMQMAAY